MNAKKEYRKRLIADLREDIAKREKELRDLIRDCPHEINLDRHKAKCAICEGDFGWYCPDSKDHICNYIHNEGKHNEYHDEDDCRYCHNPEERKHKLLMEMMTNNEKSI